jgi:coproporphyrinogen III oxidase-like Fe-S oxidoreductase
MLVEKAFAAYLKRKFASELRLSPIEGRPGPMPEPAKEYLLYIHIPFCEELCPYCSFNRFPYERDLAKRYFRSLKTEIDLYRDLGFIFSSIYVGGGTPTVLPQEIAAILDHCGKSFASPQISLETNPNHLGDDILKILKDCGVNRFSVGVQSFDNGLLKKMERFHKYGSGEEIKERLREIMGNFDTVNIDMIFNFPTQTRDMILADLEVIQDINADQVTFYPLMVSDVTAADLSRRFGEISHKKEKEFYELIDQTLAKDYACGTAWCFSRRKGMIDEYIVDYGEYAGAGSGAFGYLDGAVYANTFSLEEYSNSLQGMSLPLFAKKDFSFKERIRYEFMMKLFGVEMEISACERIFQGRFMKSLRKEINGLKLIGALYRDGDKLKLTRKGRYLWVVMMREFFTGVNNFRDFCRTSE